MLYTWRGNNGGETQGSFHASTPPWSLRLWPSLTCFIRLAMSLLPSPALLVRSATLAAVLVAAVVLALLSWIVFYSSTAVKVGTQEVVWLQYG
jgi:hypothetical protein